jgi:hypothetical protein
MGLPSEALGNGNVLAKKVVKTTERGQRITVYAWHVCFSLLPTTIRIANFTYTILSSLTQSHETLNDLSFLELSIRQATFSSLQPQRIQ